MPGLKMTRVNIVPVYELTDQHLIAEYREIPMVPQALRRTLRSKNGLDRKKIKPVYTLNKGHVTFFYDKLKYLEKRYVEIFFEMKKRGFNPDPHRDNKLKGLPVNLYNDFEPTDIEKEINRERINLRIKQKPNFYRYKGKPL
jgi:deoxyribonuclease (pyrimidine dimer)